MYRHLGHDPDREAPTIRVVANERARPLLALPAEQTKGSEPTPGDSQLPAALNRVLAELEITGDDRRALQKCQTDDELLECRVSPDLLDRVMDAIWPPPIPEIDSPLPGRYHEVLERLGVSGEALTALQECSTEGQLLNCGVSQDRSSESDARQDYLRTVAPLHRPSGQRTQTGSGFAARTRGSS